MSLTKTVGLFAGTTLLAGAAFGAGDVNSTMQKEINDLRAELATMKAQSGDNWLTEQRAAEIKGLVQDVLADADTRASLQGTGATAGFDNGFFLSSADGNFRLNVGGTASARFTYNNRSGSNVNPAQIDDKDNIQQQSMNNNWGFAIRHTGLDFTGYMFDPSWQYGVSLAIFDETAIIPQSLGYQTGQVFLLDAFIKKDFGEWFVKVGQFKSAITRQGSLNLWDLQMVDMANVDYVFGTQWTQGIQAGFDSDAVRGHLTFSEGVGGNSPALNSPFADIGGPSPANSLAFDGRVEFKAAGTWAQFDDEQSWQGEEFGLLIGVGGYWQKGRSQWNVGDLRGPGSEFLPDSINSFVLGGGGESWGLTADITADFGGFNLFGAFYYAGTNNYNLQYDADADELFTGISDSWGFQIQGGFFLSADFELAARYEYGDLGNGTPDAIENILSVGANMYFLKNRVKWQSDVGYSFDSMSNTAGPNNQGGGWAVTGTGWLGDAESNDGQWLVRTQFTVTF